MANRVLTTFKADETELREFQQLCRESDTTMTAKLRQFISEEVRKKRIAYEVAAEDRFRGDIVL
jgi:hypothetical protein